MVDHVGKGKTGGIRGGERSRCDGAGPRPLLSSCGHSEPEAAHFPDLSSAGERASVLNTGDWPDLKIQLRIA